MKRKKILTLFLLSFFIMWGLLALLSIQLHSTDCCTYCHDWYLECMSTGGGGNWVIIVLKNLQNA